MQPLRRAAAAVVVAAGLALTILAAPARAQSSEQILSYTVDLQIESAGTLLVAERIAYDFGTGERHGILRDLPVRFRYDNRHDRVYPVQVLEVSGSLGVPVQYTLEDVDRKLRIRIGDPDGPSPASRTTASSTGSRGRSTGLPTTTSCTGTPSATNGRCRSSTPR